MSSAKKNAYKILIASVCTVVLIILSVCISIQPKRLMSSVYNFNDVEANINKLKVGDSINYDINGYSTWKVIYIDKENNTIDVVSKDNLTDITLSTKEDFENALDTFQTEADKYVDGKKAIRARSVTRADLEYFGFDEQFWTADNYNGSIAFSGGKITYIDPEDNQETFYILPFIRYSTSQASQYNRGDIFTKDIYNISEWFVYQNNGSYLTLIPKDPILFRIQDYPEMMYDPYNVLSEFYESIRESDSNIFYAGNLMQEYGYDELNNISSIKSYYASKEQDFKIMRGYFGNDSGEGYKRLYVDYNYYRMSSRRIDCCYGGSYNEYQPVTKGFRPVVTLKYSDKKVDSKDTSSSLKIGDNVDYSAREYQNWKVLSIDNENNTVDIISGGVVKNIFLQGQDDFDNYEDILQSEVDAYKSGNNVISARLVEYGDLANLNKINDKVNAKYWINSKRQFNRQASDETSSPFNGEAYFNVGIMYYDSNTLAIEKKWVPLYIAPGTNSSNSFILSGYNGIGELSFTAGLRPVITLKLDNVQKLDDDKKQEVINKSSSTETNIKKEQETNNYYYVTNFDSSDDLGNKSDSKINDNKTDKDDKKGTVNNYYNEDDNGDDDKFIKYILIGLILLNVSIIAQVVLSAIIFKKIRKK